MKTRYLIMALGMFGLCASGARAETSTEDFVRKAAIANEFEIESSHVALDRSRNSDVREFAERMIRDHGSAGERLEDAVRDSHSHLQLPRQLDGQHRRMLKQLERSRGRSFDREYISMQTNAHAEAVRLFADYSRHGRDPEIRDFARETLPTLRSHRGHVAQLRNRY
jgi:putative membrane protein